MKQMLFAVVLIVSISARASTIDCRGEFEKLAASSTNFPARDSFIQYVKANKNDDGTYATVIGERAFVMIGYLERKNMEMHRLLFRAIQEGGIAEIDTGSVEGPKALRLLARLLKMPPAGVNETEIVGSIDVEKMLADSKKQASAWRGGIARSVNPQVMGPADVEDLTHALSELGLKRACEEVAKVSLEKCYISFRYSNQSPDTIHFFPGIRREAR